MNLWVPCCFCTQSYQALQRIIPCRLGETANVWQKHLSFPGLQAGWCDERCEFLHLVFRKAPYNPQMCELLYSTKRIGILVFGFKYYLPAASGTRPLCLGMPNFSPNPVCIIATGSIVFSYIFLYQYFIQYIILQHKLFAASRYSFSCRYVCLNGFMDGAISIASRKSCFLMPRVAA